MACGNFEGLLQRGYALPVAHIEPLYLLKGHASDKPGFIGRAVDGVVVQQDEMAVVRFPQIHFDEIRAEGSSFPDSGEGIFRGVPAAPL